MKSGRYGYVQCRCGSEMDRHQEAHLRKTGGVNYRVWYSCSVCAFREQKKMIERARVLESKRKAKGAA